MRFLATVQYQVELDCIDESKAYELIRQNKPRIGMVGCGADGLYSVQQNEYFKVIELQDID